MCVGVFDPPVAGGNKIAITQLKTTELYLIDYLITCYTGHILHAVYFLLLFSNALAANLLVYPLAQKI